jgi:hypothetical protein
MGIKNSVFGILLLPFCMGFAASFVDEILSIRAIGNGEVAFLAGIIFYPAIHYLLIRPRFLSTFAHELTHVLWGVFFRAKVRDLRVKKQSGFVNLSKTNFAIRLAPYFFPFFTVFAVLSAFVVRPEYLLFVFFLVGFTLSLHIIATFESLTIRQPDIYKTGVIFSLPFIFISNLIVVILVLNFISPKNIYVAGFIERGIMKTVYFLHSI